MLKKIQGMMLCCVAMTQAEFLIQGSFSVQMPERVFKLADYPVSYESRDPSPYDVSLGYMLSFREMAVMPVMLEGKASTLESYLNAGELESSEIAPFEVLLKPGLRLVDSDVYMIIGYQLGEFTQNVQANGHDLELRVKPNFYGAGYTKMLSDYLDYVVEAKVYYKSTYSYGFDFHAVDWDPNLTISDSRVRVGLRFKV